MVLPLAIAAAGQLGGAALTAHGQGKREDAVNDVRNQQRAAQTQFNEATQAAGQRQGEQLGGLGQQQMAQRLAFAQGLARPPQDFNQQVQLQPGAVSPQMAQFHQQGQQRVADLGQLALNAQGAQGTLAATGRADQQDQMALRNQLLGLNQQGSFIDQLGQIGGAERDLGFQVTMGDLQRQMENAQQAGANQQLLGGLVQSMSMMPMAMPGGLGGGGGALTPEQQLAQGIAQGRQQSTMAMQGTGRG